MALNHLLRTNAKDTYIEKVVADLYKTRQSAEEDELAYSTRLRGKAGACGNVFSESEIISKFLSGIRLDIKLILLTAQLDGKMPSTISPSPHSLKAKPIARWRRALECKASRARSSDHSRSPDVIPDGRTGDAVMAAVPDRGDMLEDSEESHATTYDKKVPGESRFRVDNVDLIRDQRQGRPQRARFFGRHCGSATAPEQPGYLHYEVSEDDICFECFGAGHKRPNC